jgi:hypothetical protein
MLWVLIFENMGKYNHPALEEYLLSEVTNSDSAISCCLDDDSLTLYLGKEAASTSFMFFSLLQQLGGF